MTHYGLLGSHHLVEAADDIRGAKLYGTGDEKLGKIEDVIFDHSTGEIAYAVVDTGGWLRTRKFLVPAQRLRTSVKHPEDFFCALTKEQIENFPPYDEKHLKTDTAWSDYVGRYRSKWEAHPVMRRSETDRNVTPTTKQYEHTASRSIPVSKNREPTRGDDLLDQESEIEAANAPTERIVPAGTDSVSISNSAVGIGGRWDTFQARLRERRKEAVVGCESCTVGPASVKGSENSEKLKKAI